MRRISRLYWKNEEKHHEKERIPENKHNKTYFKRLCQKKRKKRKYHKIKNNETYFTRRHSVFPIKECSLTTSDHTPYELHEIEK